MSLREVDDLWGSVDGRFDVFLFDLFNFAQPALEVLDLFLRARRQIRIKVG